MRRQAFRSVTACRPVENLPLLSKDGDWIGTINDGLRLAATLQLKWKANPRKGGMQGLSLGRIEMPTPAGAKIEILGQILGADAKEIRESAVTESARGFTIRIINPFLLYQTKGLNLVSIPQRKSEGSRQDAKQFTVMGIILSEVLKEFATTVGDERALIKSSGRLLEFSLTTDGAALVKAGAMDLSTLLPLGLMGTHTDERVRNVVNTRLPHFRRRLDLALEKVPVEQTTKIRGDLERMAEELGTRGKELKFGEELGRARRTQQSPSGRMGRGKDKNRGPELGR